MLITTDGVLGCGVGEEVGGGGAGGGDIHESISSPTTINSGAGTPGGRVDIILFI